MDYDMFLKYQEIYRFDEAKIIGKDVCTDEGWIHIVGLTRRAAGKHRSFFLLPADDGRRMAPFGGVTVLLSELEPDRTCGVGDCR